MYPGIDRPRELDALLERQRREVDANHSLAGSASVSAWPPLRGRLAVKIATCCPESRAARIR
jgi:hypothetical protein